MVNVSTRISDYDTHSPGIWIYLFSPKATIFPRVAFPQLGNSGHVVASVSIDFPSNSKGDAPIHRTVSEYSRADWYGFCHHFTDVF